MSVNLDILKKEILETLEADGFVVFRGYSRLADSDSFVAWDTDRHADYRQFLAAAKNAGEKLMVYHYREFSAGHLDDAFERLEECSLDVEEHRTLERRLREMKAYEGFTCAVELSFDHQGRIYLFNLRSDWYEDYLDLIEEIDAATPGAEDDDDDGGNSIGGYYSRN